MPSNTIKIIAIIAAFSTGFAAVSAYLILDNIQINEQLNDQEAQISELQTALQQVDEHEQQLNELENVLEQVSEQEDQIRSLLNVLQQVNEHEQQINELQTALTQLNQLQSALQQLSLQEQQLNELQDALDEANNSIEEAKTSLTNLTTQTNSLSQSTSASLAELESTVDNLEGLISDLSNLEDVVNQLLNRTPAEVYEASYKSVVVVRTPVGQGSGFFFNNSNTIITNYHVVEEETDIEIEFYDRTRTQATVIGLDAYSDVAVLSVSTTPPDVNPLNFSDQYMVGQQVVAIGAPLGLTESLSSGHISHGSRYLGIDPIIVPVFQLDLTIAPGSSGGPLLDLYGNVLGITNAYLEGVGFSFAIPLDILKLVVPALIDEGEYSHPYVGVGLVALSPEIIDLLDILNVASSQTGLLITDVAPNSPADDAGLNPAVTGVLGITAVDIILAVDGNPMLTIEDWIVYMELEVSPGQTISLSLWRSGVTSSVSVTTGEREPYSG